MLCLLLQHHVSMRLSWIRDAMPPCREKDESSTQCTLGFRLCGLQVFRASEQAVTKKDRHWGKKLTEADVVPALLEFADNGGCLHGCLGFRLWSLQQTPSVSEPLACIGLVCQCTLLTAPRARV